MEFRIYMTRKYTTEKVKKIFAEQRCELLEKEYVNSKTKMRYICNCKNTSKISLSSFLCGNRCGECGNKKKGNNIKYTIEEAKKIFEDEGCELLEEEYKNARTKMKYICRCGRLSEIRLTHFIRGHKCSGCGRERVAEKLKLTFIHLLDVDY